MSERYHEELVAELAALVGEPSPALLLAAWAQHLRRWEVPRDSFAPGRAGYLRWRQAAAAHQAEAACRILSACPVPSGVRDAVASLVRKEGLGRGDPDAQALEDAACLRFLARDLEGFAAGRSPSAVRRVLARTWRKMSPRARAVAVARAQTLPEHLRSLLEDVAHGEPAP